MQRLPKLKNNERVTRSMPRTSLLLAALIVALPWRGALAQNALAQAPNQSCVDVKIGMEQYYDCVNRQLQDATRTRPFTSRDAPYSAASPDPAVNTFNEAATREQLGSSFGHSAIPQRPPPPVFTSPLVGHH
jgi:hypothetical protein